MTFAWNTPIEPGTGPSNPPPPGPDAPASVVGAFLDRLRRAGIDWSWPDPERFGRSTDANARPPVAIAYPSSAEDVQLAVRMAGELGVSLHPVSRGCNWGYGDASAPTPGQVILDLRQMNRIVEINESTGYCVLEPGVTQGQLYEALQQRGGRLWMDATGAGPNASVVGNTLDRGFGHTRYGDHYQTACGMQVVLPGGNLLETGFGRFGNAKAHRAFPYGVGPFVDGLFAQSNFGIVTQLGLWLQPRPEAFSAFFFMTDREDQLEELIDRLAPLRRAGLLQSAIHIANDLRAVSARERYPWQDSGNTTPLPDAARAALRKRHKLGAWNGLGALTGSKATVAALRKEVRRALRGVKTVFLDDRRLKLANTLAGTLGRVGLGHSLREQLALVEPAYGLLQGKPSLEHLKGALWRVRGELPPGSPDPIQANAGLIWVSPVLPTTGEHAREVLDIIEPIYRAHGFEALVTFTMLNERAMVAVTNLAFDLRNPPEIEQAHACYPALSEALKAAGYYPYRVGPMGYDRLHDAADPYWQLSHAIKSAIDPSNVISPGRYLRT